MLRLSLALVLTAALTGDLSPEELIARLSSPDRVVREEAARTLEERSDQALPALRTARDQAKTPEVREQLAELIARVEARFLDRPTMVTLDIEDKPLGEAIEKLASQSGFAITLGDPALGERRITVKEPARLPFWLALDRIARAGHVRHDPGRLFERAGQVPESAAIRLVNGDAPAFTAHSGPLRIHLFATHRYRDVTFAANRGAVDRRTSAKVTVEIQAFAEPGRFINPNGPPRLEAIDEQGRSIAPQPPGTISESDPYQHQWLLPGQLSLLQWRVPLGLPEQGIGRTIKLRGVLPIVLTSRNPEPLVIPLASPAGKTFRQGTRSARLSQTIARGGQTKTVHFLLSDEADSNDRPGLSAGPDQDYIVDYLRDRIEFVDAQGRALSWNLAFGQPTANTNGEFLIQTSVSGAAPTELRIYRLSRLAAEIPFEFGDVPAP